MNSSTVLEDWATRPWGRATRVTMAGAGMATATLILLLAAMVEAGSWLLLITGLGLAATSVRAAQRPNLLRLGAVGGNLLAIPLIALLI